MTKAFKRLNITTAKNDSLWILNTKVGDKILDTRTNEIGTVIKETVSGNYDILHIDFNGKIRKVKPMEYLQTRKPIYKPVSSVK